MRVIGGKYKGYVFKPFRGTHTRPTTDMAKEAVCNMLASRFDVENARVLDLFAGTGNMSLEFLSRGAASVTSVDHHAKNLRYMQEIRKELHISNWNIVKADVIKYCTGQQENFDLIFADPPYDWPGVHQLVSLLMDSEILSAGGMCILEHAKTFTFDHPSLLFTKQYGISCFSIFQS